MNVINEVLEFARDYINGNQTKERENKIAQAYYQAIGETLRQGCKTCYIEAIFQIKRKMEATPCKYRLKPGALLRAFGDESKTCTNKNLTDELAEYHLRTNPGCINLFSVVPPPPEVMPELEIVAPVIEAVEPIETVEEKPKAKRTRKR